MAGWGGVKRDRGDGEKGWMMEKMAVRSLCNCAISNSTAMY